MSTSEKMSLLRDINEILGNIDELVMDEIEKSEVIDSLISMKETIIGKKTKYSA